MASRIVFKRVQVTTRPISYLSLPGRSFATQASPSSPKPTISPSRPPKRTYEKTWLTRQLEQNESARNFFLKFMSAAGYGSPKQLAARRALALYEGLCATRAEEEISFWQKECDLPPTFQSWFSITNLHVWIITARIRALPKEEADNHIQSLIDHFFQDVEDRIRLVLAPAVSPSKEPPTETSNKLVSASSGNGGSPISSSPNLQPFYTPPNGGRPGKPAPERLVTRQMKIFREQWAGLGASLDLGLIRGDTELAGAIWRNFLGGRGAKGIVLPGDISDGEKYFRRSINLVGGSTTAVRLIDARPGGLTAAEKEDDKSGLHDYSPFEADKYLRYPELMLTVASYIRRELQRLDRLSDEQVLGPRVGPNGVPVPGMEREDIPSLRFGPLRIV